jgi:hypothetical protein
MLAFEGNEFSAVSLKLGGVLRPFCVASPRRCHIFWTMALNDQAARQTRSLREYDSSRGVVSALILGGFRMPLRSMIHCLSIVPALNDAWIQLLPLWLCLGYTRRV